MPFGLINAGATYQRLVNMMFKNQIGRTMEVYVDDMLVKSKEANDHVKHLMEMFNILQRFRMKLNPQKCVFSVESCKFLGFIVNHRGIEANPAKIKAPLDMKSPTNVKQVQSLIGRIAVLNQFVSKLFDRCKEFFKAVKGAGKDFGWKVSDSILSNFVIFNQRGTEFDSEIDGKALVAVHPPPPEEVLEEFPHPWWVLHVDEAVNNGGAGAGIVLVSPEGHHLMSAIHFKFYATNNDAEYEALINGLKIALEMGVRNLIAKSDSELVVNQVNGGFQAQGPRTELYLRCTQRLIGKFKEVRLECVPREKNSNADALEKMGSQQEVVLLGSIPLESRRFLVSQR
ncbi:uncharacterized protein LOC141685325 [Apium graveolens]|uniref:uncharacterized protein LOC141685325 n=1 Tax=Apium graveolens TaxID=4045 RepID=UPI003D7A5E84